MSVDRDLDRLLDAWLDDGPFVLPERAFHAALDTVDRTPQRGERRAFWRYLTMIGTASQRRLAPLAVVGAVAAVAVITATAVALLQPRFGGPSPGEASPIVLTLEDVKTVVLQPHEAPAGTEYSETLSGRVNLGLMAGSDASLLEGWRELGLGDTWHSLFRGAGGQWASAAMLWPDAEAASQALALHRTALPAQLGGEQAIPAPALGEESACYSYTTNRVFGDAGTLCLFRVGNATFFVPGSGDGVEADEVIRVAQLVASRAAAVE